MVESVEELRKRVQEPLRRYNDLAGMLLGDRLSIHVTRWFLAAGLGPTAATALMLLCGIAGSVLLLFGDAVAVAGIALVALYYLFDCVDGEIARYRRCEKIVWAFHDYMFHLYVKSAFFLCLGVGLYRTTGELWLLGFAASALLATIFRKALYELSYTIPVRLVLLRRDEMGRRIREELVRGIEADDPADDPDGAPDEPPAYGGPLSLVREFLTNFDLFVYLFLAASIADLFLAPFSLLGAQWNAKAALLVFDGVILLLDFLDRLIHHLRSDGFVREAQRLLVQADRFRIR